MIQELFLSLLSGLSILFGLDPDSVFFFVDKMGQPLSSGVIAVCSAGIINGIILLWMKFRRELTDKNLIIWLAIPSLLYQILCSTYFNEWIGNLRVFSWIFAGTVAAGFLLMQYKDDAGKLRIPILVTLAYVSQIPGSTTILIIILFLHSQKIPLKSAVMITMMSLIPTFTYSFFVEGAEFLKGQPAVSFTAISLSYLFSCAGIFWSARLIIYAFQKNKQKVIYNFAMGAVLGLLFLTSRYGNNLSGENIIQYRFPSMGTSCEVTLWTKDTEKAKLAIEAIEKLVNSIEGSLSTYIPESEISRMNASAFESDFKCSDVLWQNLKFAEYAYKVSNGGFDVTVGPLVKLWAIKKKRSELPSQTDIDEALKIVGFDKVELNDKEKTIKFKVEGLKIDFGGLTKGWAVDQAAKLLMSKGHNKFIVNLGGNLYCSPESPDGKETYKIGIKNPKEPTKLSAKVDLKGQAVATSGNYEQFIIIEGKRYTHIIDPRTGYPVTGVDAVTVISPSATLSDILSTAIFVEGEKSITQLHKQIKNLHILYIDIVEDGQDKVMKDGLFTELDIKID